MESDAKSESSCDLTELNDDGGGLKIAADEPQIEGPTVPPENASIVREPSDDVPMEESDDADNNDEDAALYSEEEDAESDVPDSDIPQQSKAAADHDSAGAESATIKQESTAADATQYNSQAATKSQNQSVSPAGKTVKEILLENAALKAQVANLMKEIDQRYKVTDELLQLTMSQREKLNQLPMEDCRLVKVWNNKSKEHADVYISREACDMLKTGMAIVLRKKTVPNPMTVTHEVSDIESDVGDAVSIVKKSRRGRPIRPRRQDPIPSDEESESEEEKTVKPVKKIGKTNYKHLDAKLKGDRKKKPGRKPATEVKKEETSKPKVKSDYMQKIEASSKRGRARKNETDNTGESSRDNESSTSVTKRKSKILTSRNGVKKKNFPNSKSAILPKIRSARLRARAANKVSKAAKSQVVKLSKDDVSQYDKSRKSTKSVESIDRRESVIKMSKIDNDSDEVKKKLSELKRPSFASFSAQASKRSVVTVTGMPDAKVIGSTKRKTFTPVRKSVVKKDQKDYIREIKELTQRSGKAKPEPSDSAESVSDTKPRKLENSVLNIPLSPSKMKLLAARDVLKRKLNKDEVEAPEEKRAKMAVRVETSARTRGRELVKDIPTKYPETEFIEKLKELDSINKPKAKRVQDNASSNKLSRLIDSVAGRLVSSPVPLSEEMRDGKEEEIPTTVHEHCSKTDFNLTEPTEPDSGTALVGPMIPLGRPGKKIVTAIPAAATPSGSPRIRPDGIGGMASVEVKSETATEGSAGKYVFVRKTSDLSGKTVVVKMLPAARKGSGIDLNRSSSGQCVVFNQDVAKQFNLPKNIQIRTVKADDHGHLNVTDMRRTHATANVSFTGSTSPASSSQKSTANTSSETVPFLVDPAPRVAEPEIKQTRVNENDLINVDTKDDNFYDETYDSIEDLINLMDSEDGRLISIEQANWENLTGQDEPGNQEIFIDNAKARNAAEAFADDAKMDISHQRTSSGEMRLTNFETYMKEKLAFAGFLKRGKHKSVKCESQESGIGQSTDETEADSFHDSDGDVESEVDMASVNESIGEAPEIIPDSIVEEVDDNSDDSFLEKSDNINSEQASLAESGDSHVEENAEEVNIKEEVAEEVNVKEEVAEEVNVKEEAAEEVNVKEEAAEDYQLQEDIQSVLDEADEIAENNIDEEVKDLMQQYAADEEEAITEYQEEETEEKGYGEELMKNDVEEELDEYDEASREEEIDANEQSELVSKHNPEFTEEELGSSPLYRSEYGLNERENENESEIISCFDRVKANLDSDSDDAIGGECIEEETSMLQGNPDVDMRVQEKRKRRTSRKSESSVCDEISPRKALLYPPKRNKSAARNKNYKDGDVKKDVKMYAFQRPGNHTRARKKPTTLEHLADAPVPLHDSQLEISTYQVVAIIRQGRDHYHRCPRQIATDDSVLPYQSIYSDFLMKYKNQVKWSPSGSKGRNKVETSRHALLGLFRS